MDADELDFSAIIEDMDWLNKAFSMSSMHHPGGIARPLKTFNAVVLNTSFTSMGTEYFVPTEKLYPERVWVNSNGGLNFLFKANFEGEIPYDYVCINADALDDLFPTIVDKIYHGLPSGQKISQLAWQIKRRTTNKPALIQALNERCGNRSATSIAPEKEAIKAKSREDFYNALDDYGSF